MKLFFNFFLFLIVTSSYSQIGTNALEKKADSLHEKKSYSKAIRLREFYLSNIKNKQSSQYINNEIKLYLSKYYLTTNWNEKLELLEEINKKITSETSLSENFKFEFFENYYLTIGNATGDWVKSLEIALDYLKNINTKNYKLNFRKKIKLLQDIAFIYKELDNENKAIEYYKTAEEIYFKKGLIESNEVAFLYNNLGTSSYKVSDFKNSQNYYIRATSIWERDLINNTDNLILSYNSLISNLLEYGNLENAKYYLSKLKRIIFSLRDKSSLSLQKGTLLYLHNQLKINIAEKKENEASITYHQLYDYFIKLTDKKSVLVSFSDATSIYAEYSYRKKEYKKAFLLLDKAEKILIPFTDKKALIDLYSFYSYFWRELKDFNKAHFYIDEGILLCNENEFRDLAGLYTSKAMIFFQEKSFIESEKNFDKAVSYIELCKNADFYLLSYNSEIAKEYFDIYEVTKKTSCLKKAYKGYKLSVNLFNNIYENDIFNYSLEEYVKKIRNGLLNIALINPNHNVEIIEMIENTQSKYLCKNFLMNKRIKSFDEVANYLSEINTLKSKLSFYLKSNSANKFKINQLKNEIDLLERKIKEEFPYLNTFLNPNFNLNQFLSKTNSPILVYYQTDDSVYGVYIKTNDDIKVKKICDLKLLNEKVIIFLSKIDIRNSVDTVSKELYDILLAPFDIKNDEITIITNTFLNKLPFEALLNKENKFLVEQLKINYSTSLSLLELQKAKHQNKAIKIAVFQPDYKNSDYTSLPFAKKEALFLKNNFDSNYFTASQATINNFLKYKENTIYHLAMHAKIDYENEFKSKLIFHDNDLFFSDLYALNLPLDLVVLSACETGLGKSQEGEGIMSISRAFTFSGVSATIHSLWQTPDKQGYEIMQYFYEFLNEGLPKNEALQKAKIKFLSTVKAQELKHPYYWSGFVLNGNPDALVVKTNYFYFILLGLVIIGILLVFFLKFRK
ncbi:CHAT domain-containing protein [Flavobacterium jejuense]|uniref:CHAT domain-containing protein n=1 Tax=Flavobacterium jejuense TaxID=1544455 RepID=A0ABX0IP65_9FLAO|nr:CHAT domain-containing protein [Flavobacterium jejuense]NHN24268.1 CHAT domain-containing protein [Flavobacterium jejuense]